MSNVTRQIIGIICKAHWNSPKVLASSTSIIQHNACQQLTCKIYYQQKQPHRQICNDVGKYQTNWNGGICIPGLRVSSWMRIKDHTWCSTSCYYHSGRLGDGGAIDVDEPKPPHIQIRKSGRTTCIHGKDIEDEFQWMQEGEYSDKLQDYIEQENRFTRKALSTSSCFQKKLLAEMRHIETRQQPIDPFYLRSSSYEYWREPQNDGSFLYLGRSICGDHKRQVILNTADLLKRHNYPQDSAVTDIKLSRGQQYAACMVEDSASPETYNTHIIRIRDDGYEYTDVILGTVRFEFGSNNTVFYTKPSSTDSLRASQVWKHEIGEQSQDDYLVYNEKDERFFVDLYPTRDGHYMCLTSSTMQTMTEVWLIDTDPSAAETNEVITPRLVWPRQDGLEYYVEHHCGMLYILANSGDGWQVYKVPLNGSPCNPTLEMDGVFSTKFVKVGGFEIVGDSCILSVLSWDEGIKLVLKSLTNPGKTEQEMKLGSQFCTISHIPNTDINNSDEFHFSLSSPIQPPVYFSFQPTASSIAKLPGQEEIGGMEIDCSRIKCLSMDGTHVPITLFHKKELTLDENNPLLVCGYGAYGLDVETGYSPEMIPLLERGWVIAYCHIRGGGELGRRWAQDGRQLNKPHTFEDFESCISHLHEAKYSQPKLTAAYGISAGGLTVAALCNRAPHLIQAAILKMPFVDVLTTMLDPTLPLTVQDYDEYGDPKEDEAMYETIKKYCPYYNIKDQDYPPSVYVTTSMTDKRVPTYGPIKYIAKLRRSMQGSSHSHKNAKPLILLEVGQEGGHFGSLDSDVQFNQTAKEWAFLYQVMGLPQR
ncbi:prolyl endopeptidase-like [Amphiura filiformis]|uniref:prolyl endopeptidase-like n=1 Tax=Amphiura filiformis TaxID=82378 RepID=UPI003B2220EC